MRLELLCGQEQYNEWYMHHVKRVNDPKDELEFVDLNDGIYVFAAARILYTMHPEKRRLIREKAPEGIELAMGELGMFMGIGWIAIEAGLTFDEGKEAMTALFKQMERGGQEPNA